MFGGAFVIFRLHYVMFNGGNLLFSYLSLLYFTYPFLSFSLFLFAHVRIM